MFHREWWLLGERIVVNVSCHPHHWAMHWRENGAREPSHCLDTTLALGPWQFGLTIWQLGRLAWLLSWIPLPKRRSGWLIGW